MTLPERRSPTTREHETCSSKWSGTATCPDANQQPRLCNLHKPMAPLYISLSPVGLPICFRASGPSFHRNHHDDCFRKTAAAVAAAAAVHPPMVKYSQFCSRFISHRLNEKRSLGSLSFSQYSSFLILGKSKAISVKPFSIDLDSCTQTLVISLNENSSH